MKKFFTLALGLMMSASALMAQKATDLKFVIINENKEVVSELEDGAEILCTDYDVLLGVLSHLGIKNVSDAAKPVQLQLDITQLDNGSFSSCLGGSCKSESTLGTFYRPLLDGEWITRQQLSFIKAGEVEDIQSEWMCGATGKAVVKFTANLGVKDEEMSDSEVTIYNTIAGPSVTATFTNDPTGIKNVETKKADNAYYDLMGRKVVNPSNGIYIQNGKKVIK